MGERQILPVHTNSTFIAYAFLVALRVAMHASLGFTAVHSINSIIIERAGYEYAHR
ncbi:hypothetical protein BANAN_06815 [Bifidobacterium animalis subsp. animalis ATCC 25527]|nr:hypothetical protein BANAN_06815 [Bifidobacterium animalis subsp. animalis ATCC 25527]